MSTSLADKISNGTIHAGNMVGQWLDAHAVNIVLILVLTWILHRFGAQGLKRIIARTVRPDLYPTKVDREKRVKTLESLAKAIVRVGVYMIAVILIIGEINPSYTTALFASAGLITVALGFGAKDLVNDFMSGIFIITENQYRVGDVVEIAGVNGTVEDVTIRTTILRDMDGNVHHVPNGDITVTTNKTMGYSRLNEEITFAPKTDIEHVEHIINHVGQQLAAKAAFENKIKEAPHFFAVMGYGPTGTVVKIVAKVTAGDKMEVKSELYKLLDKAFKANGIEVAGSLPTPHHSAKPATTKKPAK